MKRKICVVTGSRAEFGLLRWLMQDIADAPNFELQILATGMHLSSEYGYTYREIEQAGFRINQKVDMLLSSDSAVAISKSVGLGVIGFADAFNSLKPDLIILLGDRFELISAATAALIAGIPVGHIHGGETTEGAFDESIRHSITKMSHLHFVASSEYARRVIQLGEHPQRVFNVGGLGVDAIKRIGLLNRNTLEELLDFRFGHKNLLITFHPVTLDDQNSSRQMKSLLDALAELHETKLIFTMPNADKGGVDLRIMVENFVKQNPNSRAYTSLGQLKYLSCMQFVDGVVGNSSSGIAEAPSMGIGTINIGDRQKGRLAASSVIHCPPNKTDIQKAIHSLYDPEFRATIKKTINPYGSGGAARKIIEIIGNHSLDGILKKSFYDLPERQNSLSKMINLSS